MGKIFNATEIINKRNKYAIIDVILINGWRKKTNMADESVLAYFEGHNVLDTEFQRDKHFRNYLLERKLRGHGRTLKAREERNRWYLHEHALALAKCMDFD